MSSTLIGGSLAQCTLKAAPNNERAWRLEIGEHCHNGDLRQLIGILSELVFTACGKHDVQLDKSHEQYIVQVVQEAFRRIQDNPNFLAENRQ